MLSTTSAFEAPGDGHLRNGGGFEERTRSLTPEILCGCRTTREWAFYATGDPNSGRALLAVPALFIIEATERE